MLPLPPTRWVFRNRWWALAWAAGICMLAIEVAGSHQPQPATPAASGSAKPDSSAGDDADADAKAVADALKALDAN